MTITGFTSVAGGPASASAIFTPTTITFSPSQPALATTQANPYVVVYSISDGFGGTALGTITIFVHDSPIVTTTAASNITPTTATLNGTAATGVLFSTITARFRYPTVDPRTCNDSLGIRAPSSGSSTIGAGNVFSENITGLSPTTTYFYCAIGSNLGGVTVGPVLSFTTAIAAPGSRDLNRRGAALTRRVRLRICLWM